MAKRHGWILVLLAGGVFGAGCSDANEAKVANSPTTADVSSETAATGFGNGTAGLSDAELKALRAENETLKADLEKLKTAQLKPADKAPPPMDLAKALVKTRWQDIPSGAEMGFPKDGEAVAWGGEPGTWKVEPDGTIAIKWSNGFEWTMMVNADMTVALAVNNAAQGNRMKRVP